MQAKLAFVLDNTLKFQVIVLMRRSVVEQTEANRVQIQCNPTLFSAKAAMVNMARWRQGPYQNFTSAGPTVQVL